MGEKSAAATTHKRIVAYHFNDNKYQVLCSERWLVANMSQVKFDVKETIREAAGKEGLVHEVGNVLTRGGGPGGYLAV